MLLYLENTNRSNGDLVLLLKKLASASEIVYVKEEY